MAVLQSKEIRRVYGFEKVAIVPGDVTINPDQTATELEIGLFRFAIPILASAMDTVASPSFSTQMHRAGGLGVMNLEGLQTRYDDPYKVPEEPDVVVDTSNVSSEEEVRKILLHLERKGFIDTY